MKHRPCMIDLDHKQTNKFEENYKNRTQIKYNYMLYNVLVDDNSFYIKYTKAHLNPNCIHIT